VDDKDKDDATAIQAGIDYLRSLGGGALTLGRRLHLIRTTISSPPVDKPPATDPR
jgi:hypothetical protein